MLKEAMGVVHILFLLCFLREVVVMDKARKGNMLGKSHLQGY